MKVRTDQKFLLLQDIENELVDTEGRRGSDELREQHWNIYIVMWKQRASGKLPGPSLVLCDNLDDRD